MWRFAFSVGLILGVVVGLAGYGRVLPVYLAVRVLLVVLGTTITIVGAVKAVKILLDGGQRSTTSPQVKDVDLGGLDNLENQDKNAGADVSGSSESDEELADKTDPANELEEDAEIEDLADMVSETMNEEDTED